MDFWREAGYTRSPWIPDYVRREFREWFEETENAELLAKHGEKVLPLMLSGETRCGKTSIACEMARAFGVPAYRLSIASTLSSLMGETTKAIVSALRETTLEPAALWIIDEVDGVFARRTGDARDGASKEQNSALTAALNAIENLPPHVSLVATTNELGILDPAMLARFRPVVFPKWSMLTHAERSAFARSHGFESGGNLGSYAEVVHAARKVRVGNILAEAKKKASSA